MSSCQSSGKSSLYHPHWTLANVGYLRKLITETCFPPASQRARGVLLVQIRNIYLFEKGVVKIFLFNILVENYGVLFIHVFTIIHRAFSWTIFHDESGCSSLSPGPSSAVIQRSTYSSFLPSSPHISRLSVIKQESLDNSEVFPDYPNYQVTKEKSESAEHKTSTLAHRGGYSRTVINYPAPQSPAFPTPATPSPLSPMNYPSSTFFPPHFQPKLSSYSWSGTLLSPAPSLHSSSQEELAHCRQWKFEVCFYLSKCHYIFNKYKK